MTTKAATKTISVYASRRLLEVLGESSRSARIAQCVDRYGHLVETAKLELLSVLTVEDLKAIKKAFSGHDFSVPASQLATSLERRLAAEAMKDLDSRLLDEVKALSDVHKVALIDWIETS